MNPTVSVIIPTYNRPHLIGRAIRSVLDQTYQDFEIIIIDDSENNETERVIKSFNDKRIRYIHNKKKAGFIKAKNQGAKESRSEYLVFLDDDDELLQECLRTLKGFFSPVLKMVTTWAKTNERIVKCEDKNWWATTIGSGCMIKKKDFLGFDEKCLMEDLDLGVRTLKDKRLVCIPRVLRKYHAYPEQWGQSHSTRLETEDLEIDYFYKKHYETYKKLGKKPLAWIQFLTGKTYGRVGEGGKCRLFLLWALKNHPCPKHLFYLLLAIFYLKGFQNLSLIKLKHKLFKPFMRI